MSTSPASDRPPYTQGVAFPMRFSSKADLTLVTDDAAKNDSIKLAVFVSKGGIPLMPLGSGVLELPFDPLDEPFRAFTGYRLKAAIELGVGDVSVSNELSFIEGESNVGIVVRYTNLRTAKVQSTILATPRFRTDI